MADAVLLNWKTPRHPATASTSTGPGPEPQLRSVPSRNHEAIVVRGPWPPALDPGRPFPAGDAPPLIHPDHHRGTASLVAARYDQIASGCAGEILAPQIPERTGGDRQDDGGAPCRAGPAICHIGPIAASGGAGFPRTPDRSAGHRAPQQAVFAI